MSDLKKIHLSIIIVIVGLVLSGITAFPLLHELNFLANTITGGSDDLSPSHHTGLTHWILKVREGLEVAYEAYPFIAYGTDWLAFAHLSSTRSSSPNAYPLRRTDAICETNFKIPLLPSSIQTR